MLWKLKHSYFVNFVKVINHFKEIDLIAIKTIHRNNYHLYDCTADFGKVILSVIFNLYMLPYNMEFTLMSRPIFRTKYYYFYID